jgi:small GTP-binding protein
MKPPADLGRLREFFDSINWPKLEREVAGEARTRLVIAGPVNSGKSTLFNLLMGRKVSEVSAVPGTTREAVAQGLGPFVLVDTPGFSEVGGEERTCLARAEVAKAEIVVLLLDAAAGVRQSDLSLYTSLRSSGVPVVVALNKTDLIRRDLQAVLDDLVFRLQGVEVIPISARTGEGVATRLAPALISYSEAAAVVIGRSLPAFRAQAARRITRTTALWGLLLGTEPIPGLDLPVLLGMQARMILRIAAIYGENFSAHHARELAVTLTGSLAARYVGMELAKLVPGPGWIISGIIAGLSTMAMGAAAEAYFKSGRRISLAEIQSLARRLVHWPRWPRRRGIELPAPDGAATWTVEPAEPGAETPPEEGTPDHAGLPTPPADSQPS